MSYLVLARKWRPKSFETMVGQSHILTIMRNSLKQQKLHHAYLFCGTRGVGKTTLARIFAKCLNCEQGITTTPCGECAMCKQIDAGHFPDLIEIDAASRTKVEDTRELLDNVQYAPTTGRFKVYLIDEVHMLSGHSFNALLKTLEEPPEHVKFLLATTDPQKLPITVLSRCLKLSLKMLNDSEIADHLAHILDKERISYESNALLVIAKAARGSMRDALSLMDQAIVYCDNHVQATAVNTMLGTVTVHYSYELLQAITNNQLSQLFTTSQQMDESGVDFVQALAQLVDSLYQIALYQAEPGLLQQHEHLANIRALAAAISPADCQILYQMALQGRQELPYAPSNKAGFDMILLRMMRFYPLQALEQNNKSSTAANTQVHSTKTRNAKTHNTQAQSKTSDQINSPNKLDSKTTESAAGEPTQAKLIFNIENWPEIINQLKLQGMTQMLAKQCSVANLTNSLLELTIAAKHKSLCNSKQQDDLIQALRDYCENPALQVSFNTGDHVQAPPLAQQQEQQVVKQQAASDKVKQNPQVQQLLDMFDADISETALES